METFTHELYKSHGTMFYDLMSETAPIISLICTPDVLRSIRFNFVAQIGSSRGIGRLRAKVAKSTRPSTRLTAAELSGFYLLC